MLITALLMFYILVAPLENGVDDFRATYMARTPTCHIIMAMR
jgi:hypothetical protein